MTHSTEPTAICRSCETVAHCSKAGCIPLQQLAAPAAGAPMVLVPREPTPEMIAAADKLIDCDPQWIARAYRAMVEVALTARQVAALPEEAREAARYRWLRDKSEPGICAFYLSVGDAFKGVKFARGTVDEAIDAQIAAMPATTPNNESAQ